MALKTSRERTVGCDTDRPGEGCARPSQFNIVGTWRTQAQTFAAPPFLHIEVSLIIGRSFKVRQAAGMADDSASTKRAGERGRSAAFSPLIEAFVGPHVAQSPCARNSDTDVVEVCVDGF